MKNLTCLVVFVIGCVTASSQQGTLDPEFGSSGEYIFFPGTESITYVHDMMIDSQGRIVVCGYHWTDPSESGSFIGRLLPNGTPDLTFGTDGVFNVPIESTLSAGFHGLAERANGNYILAAGTTVNGDVAIELMEITASGSVNTAFGTDGTTLTLTGTDHMIVPRLKQTPQGKVVFSYFTYANGDFNQKGDCVVHQFLANGSPDNSFGTNGRVIIGTPEANDRIFDLALDNQNNIYVGGYMDEDVFTLSTTPAMVISLDPTGQLRSSFGNNGIALFEVEGAIMNANGITISATGDVLCVGHQYFPGTFSQNGYLARLNSSGQLNANFGVVPIQLNEGEMAKVREAIDNTIIVAGVFMNGDYDDDVVVAKFTASGTPVSTFNLTGISDPWDLHYGEEKVTGLAIDMPSGNVIVAGYGFFDAEPGKGGGGIDEGDSNRGGGGGGGGGFFGEMGYVLRYSNTVQGNSVDQTGKASGSLIYPNPAMEFIRVSSDDFITELRIYSSVGQLVKSVPCEREKSVTIDLSDLASGVYSLVVMTEKKVSESHRLVLR